MRLLLSCMLAPDRHGRPVPGFKIDPNAVWESLDVIGDPVAGRATVTVETSDPASVLACEGVELIEG